MEIEFKEYLKEKYSPIVVRCYLQNVKWVLNHEEIGWFVLARLIDSIIRDYDIGGSKEEEGNYQHRSRICAIKAYREFIDNRFHELMP